MRGNWKKGGKYKKRQLIMVYVREYSAIKPVQHFVPYEYFSIKIAARYFRVHNRFSIQTQPAT